VRATALVFVLGLACAPAPTSSDRLAPEARARIETLRQLDSPSAEEVAELGRLLRESGLLLEAAERLQAALEAGTDSADVRAGLAETYMDLGYGRPVLRELNGCLRQNPRQPECLEVFGRVLERDGTPGALREARRVYAVFLDVAPDHPRAKRARSALDQLGGPLTEGDEGPASAPAIVPPAVDAPGAGGASAAHPGGAPSGDAPALNAFGRALAEAFRAMRRDAPTEAEGAFRRALELRPDHAATRAGLAEALALQGKVAEAVTTIDQAWAEAPSDPQVRLVFGSVMLQAGERRDEAIAAWEALVRDSPQVAEQYGISERLAALRRAGSDGTVAAPAASGR
jgi:predicted Zn-dependent protease